MLSILATNFETRLLLEMNYTQVIKMLTLGALLLCLEYKTRHFT